MLSKRTLALILGGALVAALALPTNEQPVTVITAEAATRPVPAFLALPEPSTTTTTTAPPTTTTAPKPTTSTTPPHKPAHVAPTSTGDCGGWEGLITVNFPSEVGKACSVMMCESKGNPSAQNSSTSASGLWQFLDSTWENITGTPAPASRYSPEAQTAAAAKLRNSSGWSQWSCH